MDQGVSLLYSTIDSLLDTLALQPRLSVLVVLVVVSPEEGEHAAKLIHLDPQVLRRLRLISRDISTCERVSRYAHSEQLLQGTPWLTHES